MQIKQSVLMYLGKQPYKRNEKKNCKLASEIKRFYDGFSKRSTGKNVVHNVLWSERKIFLKSSIVCTICE